MSRLELLLIAAFVLSSAGAARGDAAGAAPVADPAPLHDSPVVGRPALQTELPPPSALNISPQFTLGAPQPLSVGAELWRGQDPRFRAFANTGYLIFPFSGGNKSINLFSLQAGARYFPWGSGFFGSLSLGYRHAGISTDTSSFSIDGEVLATNGDIDLYTMFTGVSLGAEFPLSKKLTFAFDLGAQFPILAKGRMTLRDNTTGTDSTNSDVLGLDSSVAMTRLAKLILPQVTLFRLTWNY